jgi:HlyD family secretion protein/adhesin transport system membrane fusion protein
MSRKLKVLHAIAELTRRKARQIGSALVPKDTDLRVAASRWSAEAAANRQLRLLSQSARLEEGHAPHLVRSVALLSSAAIVGFLLWAGQTNINEVARTVGEVVPDGFLQTVDHFDGGTVKSILVREGQIVEKGDTLIRLDGAGTNEDLSAARKRQWALEVKAERLRAFVNDRAPDFARFGDADSPVIAEQADIFATMLAAEVQQRKVIDDQINQKEKVLTELEARDNAAKKNLETVKKVYQGRLLLNQQQLLAFSKLAETEKEMATLVGEVEAIDAQMRQVRDAIEELRARIASLRSLNRDSKYQELHQVASEIEQNSEQVRKLEARAARLDIKAPVRGLIKGMKINTVGSAIQPGQSLLSIVPLDEELVIETKIPPQYVGHVQVDQPVRVKISAYDYTRYGSIPGKLTFVSATTFSDGGGVPYYRGKVKLEQPFVGNIQNPILPGMTAMAEIITGEKTVLSYLLKPINASLMTAFSER